MENIDRSRFKLTKLTLSGYKSFNSEEHRINFHDITVLIGANGAGKSSLISFFKMVNFIMTDALDIFVGDQGTASSLLHFGPKVTRVEAELEFNDGKDIDKYDFTLSHASRDRIIFTDESISYHKKGERQPFKHDFDPGRNKSGLTDKSNQGYIKSTSGVISYLLKNCQVYQFHDTSSSAKIRNSGYINDNLFLRNDAGNLAAYLYSLKVNKLTVKYYEKIVRHIRAIFPQFADFVLNPSARNENYIILDWIEKSRQDYIFGPHQLSDGTLRFIALATLLLQPPNKMPKLIVIDEPELGLHPAAITELAAMVKSASQHSQIFLATQSPALLDEFDPGQVVVIERDPISQSSILKEFTSDQLKDWLSEYTLSEIWDKNILGGRP